MVLHDFIWDSQHEDINLLYWEGVESYEQHGDDQEQKHVPYIQAVDKVMEGMRDSITMEMARGTRLPY